MSNPLDANGVANTDRELWREREGDYYADSIHVTASGGIGINCGGTVIVRPLRGWFALASSHTAVEPVALAQALKNLAEGAEQEEREILYAGAAALVAAEKERDDFRSSLATTIGKLMLAEARVAELEAKLARK